MSTYLLEARNGYLLATVDGQRWLVDTGCPFSVGPGSLNISGRSVPLVAPFPGFDPEPLSRLVGVPVAGVLGGSELFRDGCRIDVPRGTLTLGGTPPGRTPLAADRVRVPGQTVPVIQTGLLGRTANVAIDTGACLGYVSRKLAAGLPGASTRRRDFIGMTGSWHETQVWELPIEIEGRQLACHWGVLPLELDALFALTGVDAIFGGELCLSRTVSFSAGGGQCWVEDRVGP